MLDLNNNPNGSLIQRIGFWKLIDTEIIDNLRQKLNTNTPHEVLISFIQGILNRQASSEKSMGLVGTDYSCIRISAIDFNATNSYLTHKPFNTMYLPDLVLSQGIAIRDFTISTIDKQNIIPEVPKNKPCPCRSGLKYKRCHGKVNRKR